MSQQAQQPEIALVLREASFRGGSGSRNRIANEDAGFVRSSDKILRAATEEVTK